MEARCDATGLSPVVWVDQYDVPTAHVMTGVRVPLRPDAQTPTPKSRMGSYVTIKVAFIVIFLLNALLWSQGSRSRVHHGHAPSFPISHISKRTLPALLVSRQYDAYSYRPGEVRGQFYCRHSSVLNVFQCQPIAIPIEDQCKFVYETCPTSSTFLSIPYLHMYFCASPTIRPFVFFGLVLWLGFLFSTLGISASEFFCPNLATIAQLLNLDEHVAGVTLLAFGNGSPDVFATFSALRTDAGSLAIGELLGAACFIISCVVGSMCIIKPFRVNRGPFLRDITFFAVAVATLLFILIDGWIYAWEAALLVMLYVAYVVTVVVGSWWEHRSERRNLLEILARSEYDDGDIQPYRDFEPYRDDREYYDFLYA